MKNGISRRHWLASATVIGLSSATCLPAAAFGAWSAASDQNGYRSQLHTTGAVYSGEGEEQRKASFKVDTELTYQEKLYRSGGNRFGLRLYQKGETTMRFGAQKPKTVQLSKECGEILVLPIDAQNHQLDFRCTNDQFTGQQQDLIRTPFNTFYFDQVANSLFAEKTSLKEGHSVKLKDRTAAGLFGLGQLSKNTLTLTVAKANKTQAIVKLSGSVEGKYLDAETSITANGSLRAIFSDQRISQVRATFEEKREKGVIGPKFDGITKLKLDPQKDLPEIGDGVRDRLLAAAEKDGTLQLQSDRNPLIVRHGADWKVVYDQPGTIIWRWVTDGEPIGQCSMVIPPTKSVRKVTLEKYAEGALSSLKEFRPKVTKKTTLKSKDGKEIFHVVISGLDDGIPVNWNHCLVHYKDGRRAEVLLTCEKAFDDLLGGTELEIAKSLKLMAQKMADLSEKKVR